MANSLALLVLSTMTIGFCMCCPIACVQLPTLGDYLSTPDTRGTPLQVRVNVSTSTDITFQPNLVQQTLRHRTGVLPAPNGCSGYFNFTSRQTGIDTVCPWRYTCDYDPQRIPAFIFHAKCDHSSPRGNVWLGRCEEVYASVSYLKTKSCNPLATNQDQAWAVTTSLVPVACNLFPHN